MQTSAGNPKRRKMLQSFALNTNQWAVRDAKDRQNQAEINGPVPARSTGVATEVSEPPETGTLDRLRMALDRLTDEQLAQVADFAESLRIEGDHNVQS